MRKRKVFTLFAADVSAFLFMVTETLKCMLFAENGKWCYNYPEKQCKVFTGLMFCTKGKAKQRFREKGTEKWIFSGKK